MDNLKLKQDPLSLNKTYYLEFVIYDCSKLDTLPSLAKLTIQEKIELKS
jgi:hypothetical protein